MRINEFCMYMRFIVSLRWKGREIKMKDHVKFVQNVERCAKCAYLVCVSGKLGFCPRNGEHICIPNSWCIKYLTCLKDGRGCDNVMERMHR